MIPVLGVPTLARPDRLAEMVASIDAPVGRLVIVDNGGGSADGVAPGAWHVRLPSNIGVAASWNLVIRTSPLAPWWALVNDDVVLAPGDLARLSESMERPGPRVSAMDGFACFALNRACVDAVGLFDENYFPAYVEDCDYERRCALAGVPIGRVPAGLRHARSSTIALDWARRGNDRTYPSNLAYHRRKWGGSPRGGESLTTPFGAGGSVRDWALDLARVADGQWERP